MDSCRRRLAAFALILLLASCSSTGESGVGSTASSQGTGGTVPTNTARPNRPAGVVRVPADKPTIQAAVDDSVAGDLILISPGIYKEGVVIELDDIVVRGLERATVIIDGEGKRENGVKVLANGVAIENLTVRNHAANGILFTGDGYDGGQQLSGFRMAYITALNNELYGLYSFGAQDGVFDNVYASGGGDSGVYVGRCDPCNTVVIDSMAEHNAVGFEGTNASGNLVIARSVWRANRVGITVNSQKLEKKWPQHDALIVGNMVDGTDAANSPSQAGGSFGLGIAIGGGRNDRIERNRVVNHVGVGIVVTDLDGFAPEGAVVTNNVLAANVTDLGLFRTSLSSLPATAGCFLGNETSSVWPVDLLTRARCGGSDGQPFTDAAPPIPRAPQGVPANRLPAPPPLDNMPDAATAPARPARAPAPFDTGSLSVPGS